MEGAFLLFQNPSYDSTNTDVSHQVSFGIIYNDNVNSSRSKRKTLLNSNVH